MTEKWVGYENGKPAGIEYYERLAGFIERLKAPHKINKLEEAINFRLREEIGPR